MWAFSFSSLIGIGDFIRKSCSPRNCFLQVSLSFSYNCSLIIGTRKFPFGQIELLIFFFSLIAFSSAREKQSSKKFGGDEKMPKTKSHLVGIFFLCLPCVLGTVKFELYQIESMVLMLLLHLCRLPMRTAGVSPM